MKVNVKDSEKIKEMLDEIQRRTTERNMSPFIIKDVSELAERKLDSLNIPKKERAGAKVFYGYEKFPKAYKYIANGTLFTLERMSSGWFMTCLKRDNCMWENNRLELTETQKKIVMDNAVASAEKFF